MTADRDVDRNRRRRRRPSFWRRLERHAAGIAARSLAIMFLGATIAHGLIAGDHLGEDGAERMVDAVAAKLGYAAETVHITGLTHHNREAVMQAIGVGPGQSLIGFDPPRARRLLENLDWVSGATVQLIFPNQLQISLKEREPFAIWQRDGLFYVIDRSGSAISSLDPARFGGLMVVTGEGAQSTAAALVNHLEAIPALLSQVKAAARVGDRRWNLYLRSGIKVLLPEAGTAAALERLVAAEERYGLRAKDVGRIDLRSDGRMTLAPTAAGKEVKVSRR